MKKWKLVVLTAMLTSLLLGMNVMAAGLNHVGVGVQGGMIQHRTAGSTIGGGISTDLFIDGKGTDWTGWVEPNAWNGWPCVNATFLDDVLWIDSYVLSNCEDLKKVTIPTSVVYMGEGVFSNCPKLTDIYYAGSKEQWEAIEGYDRIPNGVIVHYNSNGSDTTDNNNSNGSDTTDNNNSNGSDTTDNNNNSNGSDTTDNKDDEQPPVEGQSPVNTGTVDISVAAPKYNTLQLTWVPVAGAKTYEVYYSDSATDGFKLLKKVSKPNLKFSKANCGQNYYFKIVAYQKSGKTLIPCGSGEASGKTQLTGVLSPSVKEKYNSVDLKWKKIKGVKEYMVVRSDGVVISGLKSAKYTDKNVEAGRTYTYTITAKSYGEGEIVSSITASTNLSKNPKLKVKASGADSLTLSWSKVPGAVFYDVYSIDMATGERTLVETLRAPGTAYSITGLNPATPYKYMVVARAGDCEKASQQVIQTTKMIK